MLSMREMFYAEAEPVWILKPEQNKNKKDGEENSGQKNQQPEKAEYSILSSIPYYPYYYPDYVAPQPAKNEERGQNSGNKKQQPEGGQYSVLANVPYYPYYYPDYAAPQQSTKAKSNVKETKVVLKVPICCGECEETVHVALNEMKGVKFVECDTRKERVTVTTTTAAAADILLECRRLFKKSRLWTADD